MAVLEMLRSIFGQVTYLYDRDRVADDFSRKIMTERPAPGTGSYAVYSGRMGWGTSVLCNTIMLAFGEKGQKMLVPIGAMRTILLNVREARADLATLGAVLIRASDRDESRVDFSPGKYGVGRGRVTLRRVHAWVAVQGKRLPDAAREEWDDVLEMIGAGWYSVVFCYSGGDGPKAKDAPHDRARAFLSLQHYAALQFFVKWLIRAVLEGNILWVPPERELVPEEYPPLMRKKETSDAEWQALVKEREGLLALNAMRLVRTSDGAEERSYFGRNGGQSAFDRNRDRRVDAMARYTMDSLNSLCDPLWTPERSLDEAGAVIPLRSRRKYRPLCGMADERTLVSHIPIPDGWYALRSTAEMKVLEAWNEAKTSGFWPVAAGDKTALRYVDPDPLYEAHKNYAYEKGAEIVGLPGMIAYNDGTNRFTARRVQDTDLDALPVLCVIWSYRTHAYLPVLYLKHLGRERSPEYVGRTRSGYPIPMNKIVALYDRERRIWIRQFSDMQELARTIASAEIWHTLGFPFQTNKATMRQVASWADGENDEVQMELELQAEGTEEEG